MVAQTNGVKEDICTPDWAKTLEQLGKTAFGFRTNFFLNLGPDLTGGKGPIEVKIDGTSMRERGQPRLDGVDLRLGGELGELRADVRARSPARP